MARGDGIDKRIEFDGLDLDRYDFPGLRADLNDIMNLPDAVARIGLWAMGLTALGAVLTWAVFQDRMATVLLVPYVILVTLALVLVSSAIGLFLVLRARVAATNAAADRVVSTLAALHFDYLRIRTGETAVPMRPLASTLTRELVFPMLIGGGSNMVASAVAASGPIGLVIRFLTRPALGAVEGRVLEALNQADSPEADPTALEFVPELDADLPPELAGWYGAVHASLDRLGGVAGAVATGSTGTLIVVASIPAVALLLLGWLLT